jgi:site-specific recombinase XerD
VESYAYDIKFWWEFLELKDLDWRNINLSDVEDFAYWLRVGETTKVVSMQPVQAIRSEKTVNRAITAITSFYEYHIASGRSDNFIRVVKRNNPNGARVKGQERTIPVVPELLKMYNDYLIYEYPEPVSDYVFVNIWEGKVGMPMNPNVLNVMFDRLSKKTGIYVYPHLFRHTYATRLLKANYSPERVKYLLGHTSIQTTLDVYSHVINEANLFEVIEREESAE